MALTAQDSVITTQLSAIASRLDSILANMKNDIAAIKTQMIGDSSYSEKTEDRKNTAVEDSLMADKKDEMVNSESWKGHDQIPEIKSNKLDSPAKPQSSQSILKIQEEPHDPQPNLAKEEDLDDNPSNGEDQSEQVVSVKQWAQGPHRELSNRNILGDQLNLIVLPLNTKNKDLEKSLAFDLANPLEDKPLPVLPLTISRVIYVTCEPGLLTDSLPHSFPYASMFNLVHVRHQPCLVQNGYGVQNAGQAMIEWLIAWCNNYQILDLRTSRLCGWDVLIHTQLNMGGSNEVNEQ